MLIDPDKPPSFCKILLSAETFTNKMQVPSCFIKENKKMLTKTCLLKTDVAEMLWEANIVREKPNYFICEGDWPQFVLHHQLKQGDVLLFFLIEKSTFHVQPYSKKCCKNIIRERQILYEELSSSSEDDIIGPSKRAKKIVVSDTQKNITDMSKHEDDPHYNNPNRDNSSLVMVIEEEENDIAVNTTANVIKGEESQEISEGGREFEQQPNIDVEVAEANSEREEDGPKYSYRHSLVNLNGDHPYFEIVIKKTHTTFMTIPIRFAIRTNINEMKNMRLVNEKEKEWEVEIEQNGGMILMKRGWAEFRRQNKITSGQACRFTLIHGHATDVLEVQKISTPRSLQ